MIRFLIPELVQFIHSPLIQAMGSVHVVRDISMMLYALGRPQASFERNDLYSDIYPKAAVLMDFLTRNHPFADVKNAKPLLQKCYFCTLMVILSL